LPQLRENPPVSTAGAELVHRALAAFKRRDATALLECFDPDVEFRLPRNLFEGGSYQGHEGIRQALADAYETWSGFEFDDEEVEPVEHGLLVQATVTNIPRRGGPPVEYRAIYGVRVGERGINYWSSYEGRAEALAGLGAVG
jgi:ketosteroid isomerase-like protein